MTIAVAGDVHFEGVLAGRLARPATALAPATAKLAAADVAIVNLETSVGTGGRPEPGKRFTFQAPPRALSALANAGIDVATMANNHAVDFGSAALSETFEAIEDASAGDPRLDVVGIGRDVEEAFRPARVQVRGAEIAVIGASAADLDPTADPTGHWAASANRPGTADALRSPSRLLQAVGKANATVDVVVVYLHWGIQGESCPTGAQRSLARRLIGAGADVIVGSHAHQLQAAGRLGDGFVAYGMGNYVWYNPGSSATSTTGVLTMTVRPARTPAATASVTTASWQPARIGSDGLPRPVDRRSAARIVADLDRLRACARLAS